MLWHASLRTGQLIAMTWLSVCVGASLTTEALALPPPPVQAEASVLGDPARGKAKVLRVSPAESPATRYARAGRLLSVAHTHKYPQALRVSNGWFRVPQSGRSAWVMSLNGAVSGRCTTRRSRAAPSSRPRPWSTRPLLSQVLESHRFLLAVKISASASAIDPSYVEPAAYMTSCLPRHQPPPPPALRTRVLTSQ
jgi:hypothetical protein